MKGKLQAVVTRQDVFPRVYAQLDQTRAQLLVNKTTAAGRSGHSSSFGERRELVASRRSAGPSRNGSFHASVVRKRSVSRRPSLDVRKRPTQAPKRANGEANPPLGTRRISYRCHAKQWLGVGESARLRAALSPSRSLAVAGLPGGSSPGLCCPGSAAERRP